MRWIRLWICAAAILLLPALAMAQFGPGSGAPPPGDNQGGGRGMRGMGGGNSAQFLDTLFQGKDVINRSDVPEQMLPMFDRFAQRMGITNGQITRAQLSAYVAQRSGGAGSWWAAGIAGGGWSRHARWAGGWSRRLGSESRGAVSENLTGMATAC